MPLPKTKNVGTIMKKLNQEGGRSRKQKVAIALSVAREAGAHISEMKKHRKKVMTSDGYMKS